VAGTSFGTRFALRVSSAAFALLWSFEGISRYRTFHNRTFDLALYARQAWGLAHGDFYDPIVDVHFLGSHLAFVLWPLGEVGEYIGTVPVLIIAQAFALAFAAWPLAQIGARRFGDRGAWLAAGAWLLYPNIGHVASYEFHPGSIGMLPLAIALDALDRERAARFGLACLGLVLCRADFAIVGVLLGAAAMAWTRPRPLVWKQTGAIVCLASLAYLAVQLLVLKRLYPAGSSSYELHFPKWGGSPFGVIPTLFHDPAVVRDHFFQPAKLWYLPKLLLPLAFLPLLAPRWLLFALPFIAINSISSFPTTTEYYSHYLTPAIPALVVAAIDGLGRLTARFLQPRTSSISLRANVPGIAMIAMLCCLVFASWRNGGLPWSRDFDAAAFVPDAYSGEAKRTLSVIASRGSVQAPDPILPHVAERSELYRSTPPDVGARFVVLDVTHRNRYARTEDLLRTIEEPATRTWLARRDYGLVHVEQSLLTLQRGTDPRAIAQRYLPHEQGQQSGIPLTRCLTLLSAWLDPQGLELELSAQAPCPNDLALRIGAETRPRRVDLLFDGLLSPAQLRDEYAVSWHSLSPLERERILERGLRIGALRSSGDPPELGDPVTFLVPLIH
jgi:uncharacterized membrane protein